MTELASDYDSRVFLHAAAFDLLNQEIYQGDLSPVEAYVAFLDHRDEMGLSYFDYGSIPITTIGHVTSGVSAPGGAMNDIRDANGDTARKIACALHAQHAIGGARLMLPVDLKAPGWPEYEALSFWALNIAGPNLRELGKVAGGFGKIEEKIVSAIGKYSVDLQTVPAFSEELGARWVHSRGFLLALASVIRDTGVDLMPAQQVIFFADPAITLEGRGDAFLAGLFDIPRQRIVPRMPTSEMDSSHRLKSKLEVVMALASDHVLIAPDGSVLTLEKDETATGYQQ